MAQLLIKPSKLATWISCWVYLATNLTTIITLGWYVPTWDFQYAHWRLKGQLKNHNKRFTK